MAIYVFSLLVGYAPNGVDYAQGYRAGIFSKLSCPVRYIFADLPGRHDIDFYKKLGINEEDMFSMWHYLLDHTTLRSTVKAKGKLAELMETLQIREVDYQGSEIRLMKEDLVIATLVLVPGDRDHLLCIHYFDQGKLIRTEMYTDQIAYTDYFATAVSECGLYAKRTKRTYYHKNGSVAYEQIFAGDRIWYVFPDGRILTKTEFIEEFMKKLDLSEQDIILVDRFAQFDYVQPLFQWKQKARVIVVMHAGHYFEAGESAYTINFNQDYNYLFKYSGKIDSIVVSTQQQKEELTEKLLEYECTVPDIKVIPAGFVDYLRHSDRGRKNCSMVSVSRIQWHKKIHWLIESAIKAHQVNENISLDIYGSGNFDYINLMKGMVEKYYAQSYIRFLGHQDVTEVYKNYEVFLTASTFETLGLSILEAISSGTAVIGLDVKYGSRLLIHPGENGYLIDFDPGSSEESEIVDRMAEKMIEIFADPERLEKFHERSYEIASRFTVQDVEDRWRKFVQEVLHQEKRTSEPFMLGDTFNNFMCSYRKASGNFSHGRWKKRKR